MYSDDWHKNGYTIEKRIPVFDAVYFRRACDGSGNPAGVIVDYELEDDFHYELPATAWQAFCGRYLHGADDVQAFAEFIKENGLETFKGKYAFENALKEAGIEYQKAAFY